MKLLEWLNPSRWLMVLALLAAISLGAWRIYEAIDSGGYDRAKAECKAANDEANELAEAKRIKDADAAQVEAAAYERLAVTNEKLLKEARHDLFVSTQNLATCKLDTRAVRVLNDASRRAASN